MEGERRYKAIIFDLYGTLVNNFLLKEYKKMLTEMSYKNSGPGGNK